jgi:hypothetical protein
MGGGRYSTNNRVNAAAAAAAAARAQPALKPWEIQRNAALASGPAYPVVSDPVVNLPVKSVVQPAPEEFASLASPFDVDFSKLDFGGSGGYGGLDLNLSGLDIDALRETFNPTPVQPIDPPEGRAGTPTSLTTYGPNGESYYQGIQSQDYGTGPKYDNPEDALTNYAGFMSEVDSQVAQTKSKYNYNQFDPGDFARAGFSGPSSVGNQAASDKVTDYITKNNIPLSKVIDGKRQYLTTGSADSYAKLFGGDQFVGGDLVATGPVGSYSTTFRKDDNLVTQVLNDPIIGVAASFIPGGTLAITGAKAAAGIELSPIEIATGLMAGLNATGLTAPPTETMLSVGQMGPNVANTGTGLFGTTYAQTATAINVASAGDIEGAALNLVMGTDIGKDLVTTGLEKIGLDETTLTKKGIQPDDFRAGVDRAVQAAVGGADLDEALLSGFSKYVRDGGTLDIPLGGIEDVIRDIVRPIGAVGTALANFVEDSIPDVNGSGLVDTLKDLGSSFDDAVLQPPKEVIETAGKAVDANVLQPTKEVIEAAGKAVDANVLQPTKEVIEAGASVAGDVLSVVDDEVIQPVIQGVEEGASVAGDVLSAADTVVRDAASAFDDAVIQPIGDAFSDLDTAVRQALPDINGPDIDLPDINLPDINLPDFNLPSFTLGNMGDMGMMMGLMTPQANATTNKLFENELFKFKTEVGITDREELIDIEDFLTSSFSSSFDQQQRF